MEQARTTPLSSEELERKLRRLPMLPSVFGELIALDSEADDYTARVGEVAGRDPALAGRLLSVANGAVSAPASQITTLREALVRLGARRVSTLISSFAMMQVFVPTTRAQRDLWRHAVQVAVAAQEIAGRSGRGVEPQMAYVAGLLHDVGRFVQGERAADATPRVEVAEWNAPQSLIASERARLGADHCTLGWMAARIWRLPRALGEAIRLHHVHAPLVGKVSPQGEPLVRTIQQADCLSHLVLRDADGLIGLDASALEAQLAQHCVCPTWGLPPLGPDALAGLLPTLRQRSAAQFAALGLGGD
jgi:putative nucleotidyltransferase with HDIG domain